MIKWVILGLIFIIFAYTLTWCLIMGSSNDESRKIDDEEQMKWLSEYQKKNRIFCYCFVHTIIFKG